MENSTLELGVIGWENGTSPYDVPGNEGGPILAKVQLFAGRDYTQPLKPGRLQGREILARVTSGFTGLPPKGTEVLIAYPREMDDKASVGAVVIAQLSRVTDNAVYGQLKEGELCIHPESADAVSCLLMKANNLISLFTKDTSGQSMSLVLDTVQKSVQLLCQYGVVSITSDGISLLTGNGACGLQIGKDGAVHINGDLKVSGNCYLGATATLANTVLWGASGTAGLPSPHVFVAPAP